MLVEKLRFEKGTFGQSCHCHETCLSPCSPLCRCYTSPVLFSTLKPWDRHIFTSSFSLVWKEAALTSIISLFQPIQTDRVNRSLVIESFKTGEKHSIYSISVFWVNFWATSIACIELLSHLYLFWSKVHVVHIFFGKSASFYTSFSSIAYDFWFKAINHYSILE